MNIDTLDDLFLHTLKDVLYAERKGSAPSGGVGFG